MKGYTYVLQIHSDSIDLNKIDEILDVKGSFNRSEWRYIVVEKEDDNYYDFINNFLDILDSKFKKLAKLGIQKDDILFWFYYEYDQQCNMEFDTVRLKRLGDSGIGLCITCWQK